jgi:membrane protein DedA with SNARE-associated domain
MLDSLTDFFVTLSPGWLFLALFVSSYIENIVPPIPGDTVTVFAAYLVGRSQARLAEVLLSTTAGSIAGFMTLYALGRRLGPDYFVRRNYRLLPAEKFKKTGEWFRRYGLWVVLLNRFFSGIRSIISVVTGIYRLPWPHVLALSGIGCAVWNGLLIFAGYELGSNWKAVEDVLRQYNRALLFAALGLLAFWLIRRAMLAARKR